MGLTGQGHRILLAAFAATFALAGFSSKAQNTSATQTGQVFSTSTPVAKAQSADAIATPSAAVIGPYTYPDGANPMTGLQYESAEIRAAAI